MGMHAPGTSHYGLLESYLGEEGAARAWAAAKAASYRQHEFGDSVLAFRVCREIRRAA